MLVVKYRIGFIEDFDCAHCCCFLFTGKSFYENCLYFDSSCVPTGICLSILLCYSNPVTIFAFANFDGDHELTNSCVYGKNFVYCVHF